MRQDDAPDDDRGDEDYRRGHVNDGDDHRRDEDEGRAGSHEQRPRPPGAPATRRATPDTGHRPPDIRPASGGARGRHTGRPGCRGLFGVLRALDAHPWHRGSSSHAARGRGAPLLWTQEAFYWMQGEHDGFVIYNLPDGVAAAAVAAAVGATGALEGLETHQIFDHEEQAAIVKQADTARRAYKPPTA